MIKRLFDIVLALLAGLFLLLPLLLTALTVRLTSRGPVLYWSERVGRFNHIFKMPKFRSMRLGTPTVATHLLDSPQAYLTPIGAFLRRSSLDELPQLWSILEGNMSFVGPRPALFNQHDLVALRTRHGVPDKVAFDIEYLQRRSFWFDLKIIVWTFIKVAKRESVSH